MPHFTSEVDANFYRLIHTLVGSEPNDEPSERRRSMRNAFGSVQKIAPRSGPRLPEDHEFVEVRCHDLTQAGFSFFLPTRPEFSTLVAAFGTPPELIYMAAEVRHCESVLLYPSGIVERVHGEAARTSYQSVDGETATPMILVGCRFTERLEKP